MGFLNTTAKILDTTARVLNEAAFGDIRNIFRNGGLYDFRMRPIGLYQKSYGYMLDHIYRNIGNAEYVYDGYSTPIGELCNPFYNTIVRVPWFYLDDYKNSTANYLEYIRATYGATLSVENINNSENLFHLSDDASAVGFVPGEYAIDALANDADLMPNVNETGTDTYMALYSGYYNRETLRNAQVANDNRIRYRFGITSEMAGKLGINTENITVNKTYNAKEQEKDTGRFVDDVFSPLIDYVSPLEKSNYGHLVDLGYYTDFYESLTEKSKSYYDMNVFSGRTYYPSIRNSSGEVIKGGAERNVVKDKNGKVIGGDGNWIKGGTYLSSLGITTGHDTLKRKIYNSKLEDGVVSTAINEQQIRYIFGTLEEHSNISDIKNGGVYVYTENEYGSSTDITYASFNAGTRFSRYTSYGSGLTAKDLLYKTNESFKNGSYKTIIARFHTNYEETEVTDTTQTAVSQKYGISHGRNLLSKTETDSEGYNNPYCRVWTYHHQYHRLNDAIRPLPYTAQELVNNYGFNLFTADHSSQGFENGRVRLEKYGTINKNNGLVNITPIDNGDESKKVSIKNCMFSIENLAWKDAFGTDAKSKEMFQSRGLSPEQKGPFGGRIMWFPPYDLKFNEDISVNWSETNFIGRGEGIYTYANTSRSGQLSFKILVDHPSIINYWENRGKSVSNSVDDVDDPEQELLRFFAGCDMLSGKPSTIPETEAAIQDEAIPSPDTNEIRFFTFFPTNYSGKDDGGDFATKYLTNGFGAGKVKNSSGSIVDYKVPYSRPDESTYGGYEMRPGKPISGPVASDRQKNENDEIWDVEFNGETVKLYAQEGESTDKWWNRKWYYRIDNAYKNQILKKANYVDRASYGLNSSAGLTKVAEQFNVEDKNTLYSFADVYVALEGGDSSSVLAGTFDQAKVDSLKNKISQYGIDNIECIGKASSPGHSEANESLQKDRAATIKKWLLSKTGVDTNNIKVSTGGTGGEGTGINSGDESAINNKLWRSVEVVIHLKETSSKTIQAAANENSTPLEDGELHQNNYVNTPHHTLVSKSNLGIEKINYFNDLSANKMIEEKFPRDKETSTRLHNIGENMNGLAINLNESVRNGNARITEIARSAGDFTKKSEYFSYNDKGFITLNSGGKSDKNYTLNAMHDNAAQDEIAGLNNTLEDKSEIATIEGNDDKNSAVDGTNDNNNYVRYDNEAKFFSMLEKEEPFLHHKISDKIKYFDPAFHSISPEGFNARLTFLQQCTRQGPTIGSSDNGNETTANNLAFGRPPVCILRIGDFYYTKILIESLSFSFDPLMWDLNQEGIGAMPMIADINMRFKFIGGSSLAGHITRLQNALSFNYYANTEVYDNRSELAEYDENGNIVKFAPFTPNVITNS